MSISISWVMLLHKKLKMSSVDIPAAKQLCILVGQMQRGVVAEMELPTNGEKTSWPI